MANQFTSFEGWTEADRGLVTKDAEQAAEDQAERDDPDFVPDTLAERMRLGKLTKDDDAKRVQGKLGE